ncbi:hypothetical protein LVW35_15980 [Pseudomonas sp. HN11]|uniref:hypothetical protein n=1 Tax=Pseudomonas sp. HN11 TaxID=1344094 RepID=UPI001F1CDE69|nr:hypothetical protein [Pseudomonas sp. HN11]UII69187.1 hypothetical protein LVW35_15980 [Pseudomonas sp. HN11]
MSSISTSSPTSWVDTESQVRAVRSSAPHPQSTFHQFTVKQEDRADALDFFEDAARWNRVKVEQEFDQSTVGDYGGGEGTYNTIKFNFLPDRADGTFSPDYLKKTESAKRMFEGRMRSAGIQNYAPAQ